jgi:hypothetical protein
VRAARGALLAPLAGIALAAPVRAQQWPARMVVPVEASVEADHRPAGLVPTDRAWTRPLASLLVPGTGQLLAHQARGLVYLALEAWILARAIASDEAGDREQQRYRDLAFEVARRPFTSVRLEGPFEYYEAMAAWAESGAFDQDAGPGLAPETREDTFNGSVWRLARTTYFADPDSTPDPSSPAYQAALAFYESHAAREPFRWSWRDARLEQDVFRRTIRKSDAAYQEATNWLGALVLNHLASAVDALVSARAGRPRTVAPRAVPDPRSDGLRVGWRATF